MDYATKLQLLLTALLVILLNIVIKVIVRKKPLRKKRDGRAFLTNHPVRQILPYPVYDSDKMNVFLQRNSTYLSQMRIVTSPIQEVCEKWIRENSLYFPSESYRVKMFYSELYLENHIMVQVNLN